MIRLRPVPKPRIVSWFSCGDASAVATKLVIASYKETHDIVVARCIVPEEHQDNDRFSDECERWFGIPILKLRSDEYESCNDVWKKTRYMAGQKGARCSVEMKKAVRHVFEKEWFPDLQAFGYTSEENRRVKNFRAHNPEVNIITPLIENSLTKSDCHVIVHRAGIKRSIMYDLGFHNANCVGCVMSSSPRYWNLIRRYFPDVFAERAALSRELGVRLVVRGDERIFLDELPENDMFESEEAIIKSECSLLCHVAEEAIR